MYKTECIQTLNSVKKYKNQSYISKGYLFDICYTLNKFDLIKYWDYSLINHEKEEWEKIIKKKIFRHYYKRDIQQLRSNKSQFIVQILKLYNYDKYSKEIPLEIDKYLTRNNKSNKMLLRFITNNVKCNWKYKEMLLIKECPLCKQDWEHPLKHLLFKCNKIQDKYKKMKQNKNILTFEYVTNIIQIIIENKYDECINF